jgi:hypothetical protein
MLSACHVATCDGRALDLIGSAMQEYRRFLRQKYFFWNSLLNEDSTGNDIQGHEKKLECGLRRYDMSHLGK